MADRDSILDNAFADDGMEDACREITTKPYKALQNAMDEYASKYRSKYEESNQFICDLGKLIGLDGLGYDDLKATIDDFRDAIDEKKKEFCLELLEYMGNHNVRCAEGLTERKFYYKGEWISKEQLFENFL